MRRLILVICTALLLVSCAAPRPIARALTPTPQAATTPTPGLTPLSGVAVASTATPVAPAAAPVAPTTAAAAPWRFVVLGDTRTEGLMPPEAMDRVVAQAASAAPDMVLANGDLIKAMDDPDSVRQQWRNWHAAVAPLAPATSHAGPWLLPTPGNHDVEGHDWATGLMAEAFPELPANGPPGFERLTYAVDYRGVRFISLHSEIFGDAHHFGDAQLAWLEEQLRANPNRYTFVFSHDPAYPAGPHIGSSLDVYPAERDRFWQLLRDYHVTAYIAGHEHLYNRREIDGGVQLIIGTSGSWPYGGFGGDFFHYAVAEVTDGGVTFVIYDIDGVERDRFTLG